MSDRLLREIAALREQLEDRDETIRQLRAELKGPPHRFPSAWGLKPQGYAILAALYGWKREWMSATAIMAAVRGLDDGEVECPSDWVRPRISQIRRLLPAVRIEAQRRLGYRMTEADRAFLAPYVR